MSEDRERKRAMWRRSIAGRLYIGQIAHEGDREASPLGGWLWTAYTGRLHRPYAVACKIERDGTRQVARIGNNLNQLAR